MTTAYQLSLFCRYDLIVEFDWRREMIEQSIRSETNRLQSMTHQDCISTLSAENEISPLELWHSERTITVEPDGIGEGTSEQSLCYTARLSFGGDEQLWQFDPGGPAAEYPDGEIFRRELIVAVLASNEREAELRIDERLAQLERVIERQTSRIAEFNASLPHYIEARLRCISPYPRFH